MTSPLANRSDFLAAIGGIEAEWSTIEHGILILFQQLMGVDGPRAHAVFSQLSNHRLRREVLLSVAEVTLAGRPELAALRNIERRIAKAGQRRNVIVHATWGVSNGDIFILDPRRNWTPTQVHISDLLDLQATVREIYRDLIRVFKAVHRTATVPPPDTAAAAAGLATITPTTIAPTAPDDQPASG